MLKSKPPLLLRIERFQAHSLNREKYTSNNLHNELFSYVLILCAVNKYGCSVNVPQDLSEEWFHLDTEN